MLASLSRSKYWAEDVAQALSFERFNCVQYAALLECFLSLSVYIFGVPHSKFEHGNLINSVIDYKIFLHFVTHQWFCRHCWNIILPDRVAAFHVGKEKLINLCSWHAMNVHFCLWRLVCLTVHFRSWHDLYCGGSIC